MGHFTGRIVITPAGGNLWQVLKKFDYITDKGEIINIPVGFEFDGASIPKVGWIVVGHPLSQEYLAPSAIHDSLYRTQELSRKRSDHIFKEAMRDKGVDWWKRTMMWSAVRMFGWKPWDDYNKSS